MSNVTKILDEDGAILLTSDIKTLADATYPQQNTIATIYDSTAAYSVGDYCIKNGLLYRCKTVVNAGGESWDPTHWDQTQVINEIPSDYLHITEQIPALTTSQNLRVLQNQGWNIQNNWKVDTITLSSNDWVETETDSGIFTQDITITGSTSSSVVTLYFSSATQLALAYSSSTNLHVTNTDGTLTAVVETAAPQSGLVLPYRITNVTQ